MIKAVVNDSLSFDIDINYSHDGSMLLGTGGALKKAFPLLGECFFVLYGDSFLPIDFNAVEHAFFKKKKNALLTVLKNKNQWDTSNVLFKNDQLIEYNKMEPRQDMHFIDYGLGILTKTAFNEFENQQAFDLAEVYHKLSLEGQLSGYEVYERFYEIGSPEGIKQAEKYFLEEK